MINIIITVDYEIFGDGTGDVRDNLIRPMEKIQSLCNRFGVKLTIFFDICEYWAFKRAEEQNLLNHLGYSPSTLMKNQIKQLINDGHDVQLHIHPQWLEAYYDKNKWQLNFDKFRIADLPFNEMRELLVKAKYDLEEMIKPFTPQYECIVFRAGAFSIQPSEVLIRALNETGILIDSSVVKGLTRFDEPFRVDFSKAYSSFRPWWVKKDILKNVTKDKGEILEVPIYTKETKRFWHFLLLKIQLWTGIKKDIQRMYPKEYSLSWKLSLGDKLSIGYLKHLFENMAVMWDFCELTNREMIVLLKEAIKKRNKQNISYLPLVMIGHPKFYDNHKNFEAFLRYASEHFVKKGIVSFGTFCDLKGTILEKKQ